jgi:hypothetical protein
MSKHKSEDLKISDVEYYLDSNKTQEEVCNIFILKAINKTLSIGIF